jgi:FkbM family methyltransferase
MELPSNEKLIKTVYRGASIPIIIRKRSRSDPEQIKEIFRDDVYGPILDRIKCKNEIVIDVGAYIGDTMVLFHLHGAKKVYAFEPHPTLFNLAVKNSRLNDITFKIKRIGLSDQTEIIDVMGRATRSFGHGKGPFLDPNKDHHHQLIKLVPAKREIKRIIQNYRKIKLLKIDCEGYETKVLPSIKNELTKIKHLVIECHGKKRLAFITQLINEIGMKIHSTSNIYTINTNQMWTLHASW